MGSAVQADRTERISGNETWPPSSARQRVDGGRGEDGAGIGMAQSGPLTSHRPARASPGPAASPAALAPPPQRLPSGSPGPRAPAEQLRVAARPTRRRGRSGRRRSMRSSHGPPRREGARGGRSWKPPSRRSGVRSGRQPFLSSLLGSCPSLAWVCLPRTHDT